MKKTWKGAAALVCAGVLLFTGCGGGSEGQTNSASGQDSMETASVQIAPGQEGLENASGTGGANSDDFDEAQAVKIGIPTAKADPDSPDKEETVHVKAEPDGTVTEVKVDNVLHVYDSEDVADVSELSEIRNTEGDEDFQKDGSDIAWQNLGSDIKYQGKSESDVPIGVTVTYWLDGQEITPQDLAGQSGHVKIRFDYENKTSMTVAVHDKSYNVKVPFIVMTAMMLPEDTFAHIDVTNGRCVSFEDQNMVLGYAIPGLAESLRLNEFEPTEEVEIPSYVEVECDAQDFELSFTATVATNGLFKDIKDDDLDDIDELTDNMKELNDATSEMVDGAGKLLEGTEAFESGLAEYVSAVSQVSSGMSQLQGGLAQLSDNKGKLYEGSAALSQGLSKLEESLPESLTVAGLTGDKKLEDILNSLAADAKVLADAMVTLKGENEWEKVFEDMQSYVALVKASYSGAEAELARAEAEYENLSDSIADSVSSSASEIGAAAGAAANSAANDRISEIVSSIDLSSADLTEEQEEMIRAQIAADLSGIDISGDVSEAVSADAESRIESTVLSVEEERMAHVTAARACLDQITEAASSNQEAIAALDTETIQKAADDMKKQFLALTEYTDDMDSLNANVESIRQMYSDMKSGIKQLSTGSGQLTEGISQFNSGIDALYDGAVLLTQGTSALESYGSPLLEGASALTEGMSALHEGIQTFDEEAIQELTDLAGDDLLNLSSRIRAIKICDTSYQTFSGLAPGMKGSVKFIIETEEIVRD